MKLRGVEFGDDEEPVEITVSMTVDEAAVIYAFAGRTAPCDVTKATGDVRWSHALGEVADCLSGSFFNRFYDSGAGDVLAVTPDQIAAAKAQRQGGEEGGAG